VWNVLREHAEAHPELFMHGLEQPAGLAG
jgi:hypothetical protein